MKFHCLFDSPSLFALSCVPPAGQKERQETADGLEVTIATNHFGHFLLTNLLLPHLKRTAEAALASGAPVPRVVCVSSNGYTGIPLYYRPVLDIDENGDDLNVRSFPLSCSPSSLLSLLFFSVVFM